MNWKKSTNLKTCRFKARVAWSPLEGNKRRATLNRTRIIIRTRKGGPTIFEASKILLPALYDEGDFAIEFLGDEQLGHFEVKSLNGVPFLHNRNYSFHALVCKNDTLDFDYNRLEVIGEGNEKGKPNLSLKSWPENLSIFLEGETGTGKTTMAKCIHDELHDSSLPFISVNLSAFNSGLIESELFGHEKGAFTGAHRDKKGAFELAGRGTLFIDEVDSLPLELQVKVLSFLDDFKFRPVGSEQLKEARCRVIFASGRRLESLIENLTFRMDLFFRIQSGLKVKLDPLRESPQLIKKIVKEFELDQCVSFSNDCMDLYLNSNWPGNIRQLKSHLWRKLYSGHSSGLIRLTEEDYELQQFGAKLESRQSSNLLDLKSIKHKHCKKVLMSSHGSVSLAAKRLDIAQTTLRRILAS